MRASSRACQDAEEQRVEIVGLPCLHSRWHPKTEFPQLVVRAPSPVTTNKATSSWWFDFLKVRTSGERLCSRSQTRVTWSVSLARTNRRSKRRKARTSSNLEKVVLSIPAICCGRDRLYLRWCIARRGGATKRCFELAVLSRVHLPRSRTNSSYRRRRPRCHESDSRSRVAEPCAATPRRRWSRRLPSQQRRHRRHRHRWHRSPPQSLRRHRHQPGRRTPVQEAAELSSAWQGSAKA